MFTRTFLVPSSNLADVDRVKARSNLDLSNFVNDEITSYINHRDSYKNILTSNENSPYLFKDLGNFDPTRINQLLLEDSLNISNMAFQDQSDVFIHGGHITNLRNLQVLENLEIMESNDDVDITLNDFMSSNIYLRCMSANGHAKWDYLPISQSYLNDKKDQVPSSFAMSNLFSNILDEIDSAIIDNIDSTHSYLNTSLKNKSARSYTVNDLYTYLNNKIENLDTTIDAGEIETSMIGDEQITPRKLSGSIPYTKLLLADGVIPPEKLSTIPYDKLIIENGSIDVKKLTGSIDSNLLPTLSQISGRITENQLPPTIPENRLPEVVLQSKTVTLQSNVDQQLSLIISSGLNNVSTTIVSRVNGIDPFHATTNNVSGQVDISMNEDFLEHLSEDLIELVSGEVEVFVNKYKSEKFTTFIEFESQKNDTEYPTTKSVVKYVSDGFFKKSNISQNISDQEESSPQPKQFYSVQCFLGIQTRTSVCVSKLQRQSTPEQSPITETKKRVPLSPSNFLPSSVPMSGNFLTNTHICLCVEITKKKNNKTESNHRDQEESSPQPKQFYSVQCCSLVSHFPYTYAHLSVRRNYKDKIQQDRIQSQRQRGGFPCAQAIFFRPVFPCLAFSIILCTSYSVSKLQYTHTHLSVCRNYKDKEKQDRFQSQRQRREFSSAKAIFFCPVFPCLAFSITLCTSYRVLT